jgi:hypothetical protein
MLPHGECILVTTGSELSRDERGHWRIDEMGAFD